MDIRSLELFQHLASSLHFNKTAQALFVSPSTLSRSIQRLEQECGTSLFVRDNRKVKLTAAGAKLLSFSQQTLSEWKKIKIELQLDQQQLQGELSLFCSVTASQSHLPNLLDSFRHKYPQVEIKLTTGDPAWSASKVMQQEVDAAIAIYTPDFPAELKFLPLDKIPLVLIAPKDWQLTRLEQFEWSNHSFILPESGPSKRIVHHWFAEQGIRPRVYATVAGNEAIVSMVALGCGLGIVPEVVLDHSTLAKKVNRIELDNIEPYQLGLCCLRKRVGEPAIQALLNV
ncbi:HTH-type transcriptional activator IlvY [uncultured Paraglaciecola sp.]|uniref:HTH-type transcriptional activator IlvY n=1 Tax=uncultured Paraglaciecola sp. TaxID=1765024 RepID=UPI002626A4D6|nr:HTH-type transcriptional activator IlvY [uncultured Paraglaciecola sp.]